MPKRTKKTPEDYGLMAFRVSKEKQQELESRIRKLIDKRNQKREEDERIWRKNEVILEALERGLKYLEQK